MMSDNLIVVEGSIVQVILACSMLQDICALVMRWLPPPSPDWGWLDLFSQCPYFWEPGTKNCMPKEGINFF